MDLISAVFLIHSSVGADLAFKGRIALLHYELAFSKSKGSTNIYLTSGSDIILFTAEVNFVKKQKTKKSVKASFWLYIIFVYYSKLFLDSSTLSQAFKAALWHRPKM